MCGCFTCMKDMSVPPLCHESMEARRVNRSPGTGIKEPGDLPSRQALEIKPWSSGRASSVLNH